MTIVSNEAARQVYRKAFTVGSLKKQMGAVVALSEADRRGWFRGYDWVVRLNPDVIVREDRFLHKSMADEGIDAVLAFCTATGGRIHTDFMVWRPAKVPPGAFVLPPNITTTCARSAQNRCNAEHRATRAFAPLIASGRYATLPQTYGPGRGGCRVDSATADSRVVHAMQAAVPACDAPSRRLAARRPGR